jgi:hypothetical protein
MYYVAQDLQSDGVTTPIAVQLLCLGLALSAVAYFWRAAVGHILLALFTAVTLFSIGTTDSRATVFHGVVLMILLLPLIAHRWKALGDPVVAARGSQPFCSE